MSLERASQCVALALCGTMVGGPFGRVGLVLIFRYEVRLNEGMHSRSVQVLLCVALVT